ARVCLETTAATTIHATTTIQPKNKLRSQTLQCAGSLGGKAIQAAHFSMLWRNENRNHHSDLKDEGAFQHKEFFALCPSENSWQIDAMKPKRKFQVILLLAQWYSRSGNGVCLNASAPNSNPANDSYRNEPA